MTVEEVATSLFVRQVHVRLLIERGDLTGAPTDKGQFVIDDASVDGYRALLKLAAKEYFNSQDESNDPLGL